MGFRISIPGIGNRQVETGNGRPSPEPTVRQNAGAIKARSYGYRSGAAPLARTGTIGSDKPLPRRGSQRDEISVPASVAVVDGDSFSPGRGYMGRTEDALNTGRPPNRIDRGTTARNRGKISVIGSPNGMDGWPYDGNALFIPHQIIPRKPITVTPFQRTIDTGLTVSAPAIGGPIS